MDSLLFLCHRIPFPPNKGDKIRSYNIIRHLARHFDVYLGTFIDDPVDEQYRDKLGEFCREAKVISIDRRWRTARSLTGLLSGQALSVAFYADSGMQRWVAGILDRVRPRVAFAYSSTMAQYLMNPACESISRVVDYVDVDSAKWAAYAARKSWPKRLVYQREARQLAEFEQQVASRVDSCVFVSEPEARLFTISVQAPPQNVHYINNGVDLDYFSRRSGVPSPYVCSSDEDVLVFTGAMDYWANVDAVAWFAHEALPLVQQRCPRTEFWIVGSRPTPAVMALARMPGVRVTGSVPDIRPYLQHARVAVAPMRIARGVQNKVLEAMAMATPVVGTHDAFEGLELPGDYACNVADTAAEIAARCVALLERQDAEPIVALGRAYVERAHSWSHSMSALMKLVA